MSYRMCIRFRANAKYGDNGMGSSNRIICTGDNKPRCVGCPFYTKIIAPIRVISLDEQTKSIKDGE